MDIYNTCDIQLYYTDNKINEVNDIKYVKDKNKMSRSNKIENLVNRYIERHIKDRHLSDDTIKEIKIAYIMIIKDFIAIVDKSTSMNEDDIIYVVNNISSILYEPVEISNTDKKILEIGIALGLKSAISCIFGSLLKDDCNIKDEIIDISKHIKEKLISNKME